MKIFQIAFLKKVRLKKISPSSKLALTGRPTKSVVTLALKGENKTERQAIEYKLYHIEH